MNTLFRLLSLLLCLELIVSPVAPHLSILGQPVMAESGSCEKGFNWDSTLNRCLTSTETANVMNAVASCAAGDVECYKSNAQAALATKEQSGEMPKAVANKGAMAKGMNAAAVAVPLGLAAYTLLKKKEKTKCKAYSLYAMVGAGAALFAGDIIANMKHEKRLKDIEKDWKNIVKDGAAEETNKDNKKTNATEAQSQAFEMLARSEDSMAAAAKMKSTFNATAMAAFAAVAAWSTYETIQLATAKGRWLKAKVAAAADMTQASKAELVAAYQDYTMKYDKYTCSEAPVDAESEAAVKELTPVEAAGDNSAQSFGVQDNVPTQSAPLSDETQGFQPVNENPNTPPVGTTGGTTSQIFWNSYSERITKLNIDSAPNLAALHVLLNHQDSLTSRNSSPTLDEYEEALNLFSDFKINDDKTLLALMKDTIKTIGSNIHPFPVAQANESGGTGWVAGIGKFFGQLFGRTKNNPAVKAGMEVVKKIDINFKTPVTRAVISGVFAGWAGVMYAHTKKQQKASEERAKLLRKMKEEFNIASGAVNMCASEDRNNTGKPECYCYTSEGGRNPNRTNSKICQQLFAGINTAEGNYYGSSAASTKGCISNTQVFDATCSCKSTNTCLKTSATSNFAGLNAGTFSMLSGPLKTIDGIADGSVDTATVNGDAAVNNAMRIMDATDKLQNAKGAEEIKKSKANSNALENSLIAGASGITPNLGGSSAGSFSNLSPTQAAAMLEKELESPTMGPVGGASDSFAGSVGGNSDTPQLDFGMTGDQFNAQQGQVAEVMKENFDYGTNDINEGSKTNIFEVLSNRYQRSGMRRLFDEKGTTQQPAPAKTDITK